MCREYVMWRMAYSSAFKLNLRFLLAWSLHQEASKNDGRHRAKAHTVCTYLEDGVNRCESTMSVDIWVTRCDKVAIVSGKKIRGGKNISACEVHHQWAVPSLASELVDHSSRARVESTLP